MYSQHNIFRLLKLQINGFSLDEKYNLNFANSTETPTHINTIRLTYHLYYFWTYKNCTNLEFHGRQLVQNAAHAVLNNTPGNLVFTLCCRLNSVSWHVKECNHVAQHAYRLVERAEPIVRWVAKGTKQLF